MPRNGSGVYSLPQAPFSPGTVISSAAMNSDLSDIAAALTGSLARDGQAGMTGQLKVADGSASVPGWAFSNEATTGFSRPSTGTISVDILGTQVATITSAGWVGPVQGGNPIGMVADFAGSTAPTQWILCFGQAISRTTYALLFGVIGTTYGVGDGSTTFNLPDLRGRAVFGVDNMGGSAAGRITAAGGNFDGTVLGGNGGGQNQTLTLAQLPSITSSGANAISVILNGAAGTNGVPITTTAGNVFGAVVNGGTTIFAASSTAASWAGATATSNGNNTITVSSTGTSSTPHTILSPAFMFNKIIYAGA